MSGEQREDDAFIRELRRRYEEAMREPRPDLRELLPKELIKSATPTDKNPKPFGGKS